MMQEMVCKCVLFGDIRRFRWDLNKDFGELKDYVAGLYRLKESSKILFKTNNQNGELIECNNYQDLKEAEKLAKESNNVVRLNVEYPGMDGWQKVEKKEKKIPTEEELEIEMKVLEEYGFKDKDKVKKVMKEHYHSKEDFSKVIDILFADSGLKNPTTKKKKVTAHS
eukprot:TRINITY_DN14459_c0_g1_i1.p1 TRINITY_DN14459_c0_g1~~TRINITY_DN14459_c0_g1_i1.p1  ORF type:complete len:167 (+),score=55.73 TRINITY_DN14459_c0_g1_i1:69-569(+)